MSFIILYVDDAAASTEFYGSLFGVEPVESSPHFSMFKLESGLTLGLWSRQQVEPATTVPAGGMEVVFAKPDRAAVDAIFSHWQERGLSFAQQPVAMAFGYTFVALDPNGHRLRVYCREGG